MLMLWAEAHMLLPCPVLAWTAHCVMHVRLRVSMLALALFKYEAPRHACLSRGGVKHNGRPWHNC